LLLYTPATKIFAKLFNKTKECGLKLLKTLWFFLLGFSSVAQSNTESSLHAPLFNNLSAYHHPISTSVPLAQRFFNQGLILYYGFEWGEAIRSFREAARLDPKCAMCYWGIALALGSKINAPVKGNEYSKAKQAIEQALSLKKYTTPIELGYIKALALRFQHEPKKIIPRTGTFSCHIASDAFDTSSKQEIANFAHALKKLIKIYPADNDIKALYAFALFDVNSWVFWDINGKIRPNTSTAIETLKSILKSDPRHIGGNHYYIHIIEQSPHPEQALASATQLKTLVPWSEHLVHMPAHIYFLTGRYHEGSKSNSLAIAAFKNYNKACRDQGFEPEINYLYFHNFDFLRTTAIMEGSKQIALSAAFNMLEEPFSTWLANELSLQWFIPIPYYVKARFAMWDELLKEKKPAKKYTYAIGMWHYARGMALINKGSIKSSKRESLALNNIINNGPTQNTLEKNGIKLLKIANLILDANIASYEGKEQLVFANLKSAENIQYNMGYHEPPDWYFPVTEALADAYLQWNHPQQASIMYKKVLRQYPQNGWALYGLANSLRALGKIQAAVLIEKEFNQAWRYADIPLPISLTVPPAKCTIR